MIRLNKSQAKKYFNSGKRLYMLPCKVKFNNPWMIPFHFTKDEIGGATFDYVVNMYEYHNCRHNETGKHVSFYAEEEM